MRSDDRVGVVIQARSSSRRLPGKVLRPLAGRPLLAWVIDGVRRSRLGSTTIVATSTEAEDDAIADLALEQGVACHRGPLDDVATRLLDAATSAGLDVLARISGDSPLVLPAVIDTVTEALVQGVDVATNVRPRTFPPGQSVEVLRTSLLAASIAEGMSPEEREHVLPYFYNREDRYVVRNVEHSRDLSGIAMTVDTEADFQRLDRFLRSLEQPPWKHDLDDLAEMLR